MTGATADMFRQAWSSSLRPVAPGRTRRKYWPRSTVSCSSTAIRIIIVSCAPLPKTRLRRIAEFHKIEINIPCASRTEVACALRYDRVPRDRVGYMAATSVPRQTVLQKSAPPIDSCEFRISPSRRSGTSRLAANGNPPMCTLQPENAAPNLGGASSISSYRSQSPQQ
jgi:hypothetical protein